MCKDKVATIRLKEIINNAVTEVHLCQSCFEMHEQKGAFLESASAQEKETGEAQPEGGKQKAKSKTKPKKCPACGTTEEQFRSKGRIGCGDCYRVFASAMTPILATIHGATEHRGKAPHHAVRTLDLKLELQRLQEDLQRAILSENYERAAKLRDKIKQFENM
ncbi:MAG: UvrB/UvrC motif-containing protein [Candidatus Lindowbacteria bacterium]|nr:UvrB/UvrC motif-containing protein [Candidatus Lindowbacteria bacterium]